MGATQLPLGRGGGEARRGCMVRGPGLGLSLVIRRFGCSAVGYRVFGAGSSSRLEQRTAGKVSLHFLISLSRSATREATRLYNVYK